MKPRIAVVGQGWNNQVKKSLTFLPTNFAKVFDALVYKLIGYFFHYIGDTENLPTLYVKWIGCQMFLVE